MYEDVSSDIDSEKIIEFPITDSLRPEQALAIAQKTPWQQCLIIGLNDEGGYQIINSEMPCERAVWLLEWAKKWALEGRF